MTISRITLLSLWCALAATQLFAAPTLTVTPLGINGSNNLEWAVDVTRDPSQAVTSMAVELAFAVDNTNLISVDVNEAVWDFELIGNNPFTGTETEGLWLDLIGDRTFGAFGSAIITSLSPQRLFTIVTQGDVETTLRYGTAASGNPNLGNIIAAHVLNRYSGSVTYTPTSTVPEPASASLCILGLLAAIGVSRRRLC